MQATDHILVLDDDPGTLTLAERRLSHAGFRVTPCRTIAAARALIEAPSGVDLLVVDYSLEGEVDSGLDFLRSLALENLGVPSVLMTGYVTEERILDALRSGVSDVVRKSEGYLELLPSVARRVLNNFRMQKELMLAEEGRRYYHLLTNAIPHLVYTVDIGGQLRYANTRWNAFIGVHLSAREPMNWIDLMVAPEDHALTRAAFESGVTERHFSVIHRLRPVNQSARWFATRGVLLRLDTDSETCLLTSTDIDQQYRDAQDNAALLESERLARAAAEAATRAKDDFVATVSHELRSPLNAVVGWSEVLLRDPLISDKQKAGLEIILRNGKAQARMIDDLLDMSSMLAGRLRLDLQTVDLGELMTMAVMAVHPSIEGKGLELRYTEPPRSLVHGDPARLQQVLWNLMINAVKFTDPGGYIAVDLQPQSGEHVITVADSGRGIAADFLPHVFDRFRQESGSTRTKGGLGLGLAITRELVELHGGTITAQSDGVGLGARFTIRLPCYVPEHDGADLHGSQSRDSLRNLRLLVVEDDDDARAFIIAGLKQEGAQVWAAASAPEALVLFRTQRPDMILSDLGLGQTDGHTLMRAIRAFEDQERIAPTPAVALTALTRPEDRQRSLDAGFNAHLAKPVDHLELMRVLKSLKEGALP